MDRELKAKIKELPFFKREDLRDLGGSEKNIEMFIYRAVKKGELLRLRRGLYTTKAYIEKMQSQGHYGRYLEFLANKLVEPSYISSEYLLAKYNLLTESVTTITSYTRSRGRLIANDLGFFRYRNIKRDLYCDFLTIKEDGYLIKIASQMKALFDYLYMKKKELHIVNEETLLELRLNLELLEEDRWLELEKLISESKSKKLKTIFKGLYRLYAN